MSINDKLNSLLSGGDLRSIGRANEIVKLIYTQEDFDILFGYLYCDNRLIVMKAADSIEKISRKQNSFLKMHKESIFELIKNAKDKEQKWHLAQLSSKLELNDHEKNAIFELLIVWLKNKNESKIVRVNSIQALSEICANSELLRKRLDTILNGIEKENIPSINARIRKLKEG